ncbi:MULTISPECIES: RNA methyltransferase [Caldilinea]|jgi:TrmH family RNA methyltransferase|uniref:RNA methyltransferase n=1 Tax=Caldilinea TaxID=233191 RepID=UPI0005C61BEE|nr:MULTISPECIES: RNA methyltransferase [Caldilinea]MBO9393801.1 RNA methyltransferase [Caldilinea sp.]GIV71709.1 MAG: rRNA methyltransferase [Caldilinea sp.]
MTTHLTSPHNPHVKDALKLEKRSERVRRRLTRVEGAQEVRRALAAGIVPVEAFVCPEIAAEEGMGDVVEMLERLDAQRRTRLYTVTSAVFARLAIREESGGVVLIIPFLDTRLARLPQHECPFFAVIDRPEKPGNLGAILRTADAAGVDGVIVCGGVDVHNPNVVRASLGTLFTVPVAEATAQEAIAWLKSRGIRLIATTPKAHILYTAVDMTGPVAIVMGSEAEGLGQEWLSAADVQAAIPMAGQADSLNLATATALMLYEVVRQRGNR